MWFDSTNSFIIDGYYRLSFTVLTEYLSSDASDFVQHDSHYAVRVSHMCTKLKSDIRAFDIIIQRVPGRFKNLYSDNVFSCAKR